MFEKVVLDNGRGVAENKLLVRAAELAGITIRQAEEDSIFKIQCDRLGGEERYKQLLQQNNLDLEVLKKYL